MVVTQLPYIFNTIADDGQAIFFLGPIKKIIIGKCIAMRLKSNIINGHIHSTMHMLQLNPALIIQTIHKNCNKCHNSQYRYAIIYPLATVLGKPQKW